MAESEKDKEENKEKDEKDEENNEKGEKDEENSGKEEEDEQNNSLRERARVQGEEFWKRFEAEKEVKKKEAEKQEAEKEAERRLIISTPLEETPTPPRGRTKAEARKHFHYTTRKGEEIDVEER
ncbi:Uncharacterized protein Rs2_02774 [Raphanus sativus]|nr:Uncharacterized protein Rs2_02774 [Raphanus sativus]